MDLISLGWGDFFASHCEPYTQNGLLPARVAREYRESYIIFGECGECAAEVSGKLRHEARSRADFPAVGDWVAAALRPEERRATIHAVLPRKSAFSRKAVLGGGKKDSGGKTDEQVLAANIDTVFLVSGLDFDFNVRRIERYLTIAWDSGASPVIVLNKMDLAEDPVSCIREVAAISFGVPIHPLSARQNDGLDALAAYLAPGKTVAFLGSSGVGKTTLINTLAGQELGRVQEVREDDSRGRHTTTSRELIVLPGGALVIDTPGMRGLEIWGDADTLEQSFRDIAELAEHCRFGDCAHQAEPGCAVRAALEDGSLDYRRYNNYMRLQKELEFLSRRREKGALRRVEREWDKKVRKHFAGVKELRKRGLV
jgi:ribosome biogenesis GTPase